MRGAPLRAGRADKPIRMQRYAETSASNQQNLGQHNIPIRRSEMSLERQAMDGPLATQGSGGVAAFVGREAKTAWAS